MAGPPSFSSAFSVFGVPDRPFFADPGEPVVEQSVDTPENMPRKGSETSGKAVKRQGRAVKCQGKGSEEGQSRRAVDLLLGRPEPRDVRELVGLDRRRPALDRLLAAQTSVEKTSRKGSVKGGRWEAKEKQWKAKERQWNAVEGQGKAVECSETTRKGSEMQ